MIQARRRENTPDQSRASADGHDWIGEGFTATKKIGNAVIRNRAKRRLREASRLLLPDLGHPGVDYVFIARYSTPNAPWRKLLEDVEKALKSLATDLE